MNAESPEGVVYFVGYVSIPFRADTGFELIMDVAKMTDDPKLFQSLSGLTLGLNLKYKGCPSPPDFGFNPFQG